MLKRTVGSAVTLSLITGLVVSSCIRPDANEYWRAGAVYELRVAVLDRPTRLPGIPLPPTDSVLLLVVVDSVISDSLFGTYRGSLDSLGVSLRDDDSIAPRIVGWASADSFTILIDPAFVDGHLSLRGELSNGLGGGQWHQASPAALAGRFELRRR